MLVPITQQFSFLFSLPGLVSCSSPWQIRVRPERERLPQGPHTGHLPRCGRREGALFLPVLPRPPLPATHTPAALGASPLLTVVPSKDRYTAEGPPPQRGSCLTSRGFIWAAGCWRGGSTFCKSLAYMPSLSQSMVFAVQRPVSHLPVWQSPPLPSTHTSLAAPDASDLPVFPLRANPALGHFPFLDCTC